MSEDIRLAAQQLMEGRLAAIDDVASKSRDVEHARTTLESAERSYAAAHKAAQDAGWSDRELRQLNLPSPSKRAPGRPRKRSAADSGSSPQRTPQDNTAE